MMNLLDYLAVLGIIQVILSACLIRNYASNQTSLSIIILATISFALGFSGTVLLPIDLSLAEIYNNDNHNDDDGNNDNNNNNNNNNNENENNMDMNMDMILPWHILFWSTFILAWLVLPLVREMLLSGEFTIYTRFKDGFRKLVRGLLILSLIVIIFIIWLAFHLKEVNVIPVLITLGNTYGLLLVALLLGYGLVAFPRSLWRQALPVNELRKVYLMVVKADDALYQTVWDLQDVEYSIDCAMANIVDLDETCRNDLFYKYCVNELLHRKNLTAELPPDLLSRRTTNRKNAEDDCLSSGGNENIFALGNSKDGDGDGKPPLKDLVRLNRTLKRAQENLFNAHRRWNGLLEKKQFFSGMDLESDIDLDVATIPINTNAIIVDHNSDIPRNDSSASNMSRVPLSPSKSGAPLLPAQTCKSRLKYIWIHYLRCLVYRLMALFAVVLSTAILWSEATLASKYNLSPFANIQKYLSNDDGDQNGIFFQIAALVPLLYMSICVSNGLFQVGRFGPYCLRGNRQSSGVALVFNAQYLVRLQFPLAYNYLLMLKYDTSATAFSKFIGQMDVVPLFGKSFPVYAPLLILFLCAFTLCDVYAKIMNMMGFEHQDALLLGDQQTLDAKVTEGKDLLRQYANGVTKNRRGTISVIQHEDRVVELAESKSWRNSIV